MGTLTIPFASPIGPISGSDADGSPGVTAVRALVVGGGGGGGGSHAGGGGGGGRVIRHSALAVVPGQAYPITVGAGGTGADGTGNGQTNGGDSTIGAILVAEGGGRGGSAEGATASATGGSGGGGSGGNTAAAKAGSANIVGDSIGGEAPDTTGLGSAGGTTAVAATIYTTGSGGGGAGGTGMPSSGGSGSPGAAGGTGVNDTIIGATVGYGGGGGGGGWNAAGGIATHGGGAGGPVAGPGVAGTANTGGGGGGSNAVGTRTGGAGGSGVVIIRFAVPVFHIRVAPPADWGKTTLQVAGNVSHDCYWIGWQYTADTQAPAPPFLGTLRAQLAKATGNAGVPAPEAKTYTKATVIARDVSPSASTLAVVNVATGALAIVDVPIGARIATATISLPCSAGDGLALCQILGDPAVNLGDGAVMLS